MGAPTSASGEAVRVAVVDLGTNTTRLLICDVRGREIAELERRTEITRLGEGLDASGRLADAAKERVLVTIDAYREAIERHGGDRAVAVATSAVRDAGDGDGFRAEVSRRLGFEARTITGAEEAALTFRGATSNRAPGGGPLLVLDIGGGSTEYVIGRAGGEPEHDV